MPKLAPEHMKRSHCSISCGETRVFVNPWILAAAVMWMAVTGRCLAGPAWAIWC